jgi:monofunctional biosynthetic peptidoglycan transglycosylase
MSGGPNCFVRISGLLLMTLCTLHTNASDNPAGTERLLSDFTFETADFGWFVVNDNVMGGRSEGDFRVDQGELHFAGRTNTRGGGFSSIRTNPMQLDLSGHDGIRLHVRGDGRRYTWRLTTGARWRGREVSYWADFETLKGEWSVADVPFSDFVPRFRGMELDGPALDPAEIRGMGLMIYDQLDGPFDLRLSRVSAFAAQAPFALRDYQWRRRVLVVSAPTEDNEQLEEQLQALRSSAREFSERDMVLVRLVDGSSAAGDRKLTAEEVAGTRAALGFEPGSFAVRLIGKDGTIKLSGESAVPMTEIYALIDSMPMRRREMRDRP